jgi:predicted pyridoxine 5'-phosphate oxidase superfamily flavin-nucleotide-binding protein
MQGVWEGDEAMRARLTAKEKRFIDRQRVCHVASVAKDDQPRVAPLSHTYDEARRTLYMATERAGRTATNLRAHPGSAVTFDDYSEEWARLHGVMLRTRARYRVRARAKDADEEIPSVQVDRDRLHRGASSAERHGLVGSVDAAPT